MPIYKSFADPFLMAFIHNHFNLETPYLFGNFEDTPDDKLYQKWLRSIGYVNSRRSYN